MNMQKAALAIVMLLLVPVGFGLAYAALNYRQVSEYEIADTIDVKYSTESGEFYQLGTLIVNETYQFLLNDTYVIKVYRYPGTLTIGFADDSPNATQFDSFTVTIVNMTETPQVLLLTVLNMTATRTVTFDTLPEQDYGYIFDFKVAENVEDAVQGTVELLVDFARG